MTETIYWNAEGKITRTRTAIPDFNDKRAGEAGFANVELEPQQVPLFWVDTSKRPAELVPRFPIERSFSRKKARANGRQAVSISLPPDKYRVVTKKPGAIEEFEHRGGQLQLTSKVPGVMLVSIEGIRHLPFTGNIEFER